MIPEKPVSARPAADLSFAELLCGGSELATSEKRLADDAGRACAALVDVLGSDPRIQAGYSAWDSSASLRAVHSALDRIVAEDLLLPHPWLAQLLTKQFAARVIGLSGSLDVSPAVELPGRNSKGAGKHIRRDVEWYYRAEIKSPPDSKRTLAIEWAAASGRDNDARSVVQNGIKRAKELLAAFEGERAI